MKDSGPRDLLKRARVDEEGRFKASRRWNDDVDRLEHSLASLAADEILAESRVERGGEASPAAIYGARTQVFFDRSGVAANSAEMEMIRTVHAKLRRVDSRLDALHEWVQETRVWTEKVEGSQKMKRRLEKMLTHAQIQADAIVAEAEARAREIVDQAEAKARKTAKHIVGEAEERARKIIRRAEKASALLREEAAEEREAIDAERRVFEVAQPEGRAAEVLGNRQLYESIQLFVRTNSVLLDELNELLGVMGLEQTKD